MTPALTAVYDEMLERVARGALAHRSQALRSAFAHRTGELPADHERAGARIAAAWEDALVAGGLARELAPGFDDAAERDLVDVIANGQRGLFRLATAGAHVFADDLWRGSAFVLLARDELARGIAHGALEGSVFVGRVVAASDGCAVLPGLLWLPEEATSLLDPLLTEARSLDLGFDAFADALLCMDHSWLTMSRARAQNAFRPEALRAAARPRPMTT